MSDTLPVGVHAPGLPSGAIRDMQQQLRRPEGTLVFNYYLPGLVDPSLGSGIILQIPAGNTLFRLERDDKLRLRFIHSSPGAGTRVAEVDLHELETNRMVQEQWKYFEKRQHKRRRCFIKHFESIRY